MTVEELLTHALAAEADAREVDVAALHQEVLRRLPEAPHRRGRRPLLAVAAAAALLVAGTAVGAVLVSQDEEGGGTRFTDSSSGEVATEFTCPLVNTIDFQTTEDDGFLPDLSRGTSPAEVAEMEHAETFDFTTDGDTATLRLGNADGSLGSITTYAKVGEAWEMRTAQVCAGAGDQPLAPTEDAMQLGLHGTNAWPGEEFYGVGGLPPGFVDDRPYYNLAGVIEGHRSMYVQPCRQGGWCWVSGEPGDYLIGNRIPPSTESGRPTDVSDMLVDPDMMVGRENPFGLWAYDVAGPGSFVAVLDDGTVVPAKEVTDPAWDGRRVLVVLATRAEVDTLRFTDSDGEVTTWEPADLPQD